MDTGNQVYMQTQTYRITVNYRQALALQQWANEYLLQLEITSAQNAILTLAFRSHMHCVTPRQIAEQGVHRGCPSIIGHTPSCVVTFPVRAQLCPSPRLYYQRIPQQNKLEKPRAQYVQCIRVKFIQKV